MSCSGGNTNPMMGGRKRRGGRTMRGGNFYGFGGNLTGSSAGAQWDAVANTGANSATGAPTQELYGGRRRRGRTGKKATRKGRKHGRRHGRRRTMRGGASSYNSAGVGYGFNGTGSAGLANAAVYASRVGGAPMNADGVRTA